MQVRKSPTDSKRAEQGIDPYSALKVFMGVFSDDFAAVDIREDYATIADPKKQIREDECVPEKIRQNG